MSVSGNREVSSSVLYNIEPIGLNTQFKESFSSYVSRLAISHNVTFGTLFSKIITPLLNKEYLINIAKKGGNGFYDSSNGINGIGTLAMDFVEVISSLTTRDDLKGMTMVYWSNILPSRELMRAEKAWCPECFQDALENNKVIYEQLVWTLKIVNICTIHKVKLSNRCPFCSKRMSILSRKGKPGYCSNCENWLGERCRDLRIDDNSKDLKRIMLIMQIITHNLNEMYSRERVSEGLKYYVEQIFEGNIKKAAEYFKVANSTFRYWYKGYNIPTLNSLVSICMALNISIVDFFNKVTVDQSNTTGGVALTTKNKIRKKYDHEYIKMYIDNYIEQEATTYPKSLSKIAALIGCDRRLLYIKYPKESKRIAEIYAEYLKNQKIKREEKAEYEIKIAVENLVNSNEYPSRRKVEALLGRKYLVREKKIALAWKKTLE